MVDMYRAAAAKIFGIPERDVSLEQRKAAKRFLWSSIFFEGQRVRQIREAGLNPAQATSALAVVEKTAQQIAAHSNWKSLTSREVAPVIERSLAEVLVQQCPWLLNVNTEDYDEPSGADVIDQVCELYGMLNPQPAAEAPAA